jgi:hypothetical protein
MIQYMHIIYAYPPVDFTFDDLVGFIFVSINSCTGEGIHCDIYIYAYNIA